MALKRELLKGMGLTDEQTTAIIEAHIETVDGLKSKIKTLEGDLDNLKGVQKELNDLKSGKDWKAEHDKVKKQLDDFKAEVEGKETAAKIKTAFKQLLTEESIDGKRHDAIIRATDLSGAKLDKDGKLEGADKMREDIRANWSDFKVTTERRGANPATPPTGGKVTRTKDEIMAIKDTKERQEAIKENHEIFGF